jgi:hypothetical protein
MGNGVIVPRVHNLGTEVEVGGNFYAACLFVLGMAPVIIELEAG